MTIICPYVLRIILYKDVSTYAKACKCTVGQKKKKKPIYLNTNYRAEMKLVRVIMDYCLIQFGALKFILGVRLHGVST